MENEGTGHKILRENSERKAQITTFRNKWENNIKIDF